MNFKGSEQENQWTFNWHFLKFTRLGKDSRGFESSKHDYVISKGSREKQKTRCSKLRKVLLTKASCWENIRKKHYFNLKESAQIHSLDNVLE